MNPILKQSSVIISLLFTMCARGQDTLVVYPSMLGPAPTVSVSTTHQDTLIEYSYTVLNEVNASQKIWIFMVPIEASLYSTEAPANWDISRASRPGVVTILWGAYDSAAFVGPGSASSGFSFQTSGLPKIRTFYAVGRVEPPQGEFEIVPGSNDPFINSAQGRTLAPASAPTPFVPLAFLDTLISMKDEAKHLEWIRPGGLSDEIDERLEKTRTYLESETIQDALEQLHAVRDAVDGECSQLGPTSDLTTEACALLLININYLIAQLE